MNAAHRALLPYSPYLARPARKQSEEMGKQNQQPSGTVFNIWYSKWAGGDRFGPQAAEKAETRCVIATDAGYTKASKQSFFCIHFARGCCARGHECSYWHRLPLETDRIPMTQDVFGRERFKDERDDMGGVGSFEKDNRTLYLGHLGITGGLDATVHRHFSEWGELEQVRVLSSKGVAFVRFKFRAAAEFAKEAMYCQSMDSNEILNVRWATEDPNPKAAMERKRRAEEQFGDSLQQSLPALGEEGNVLNYANYYPSATEVMANATMGPQGAQYFQVGAGMVGAQPESPSRKRKADDESDVAVKRVETMEEPPLALVVDEDEDDVGQAHPSPTREPPPPPPIQAAGVVSAETMQYLAYMAGRGQAERNVKKVAPKKVEGLGALAAYESDED